MRVLKTGLTEWDRDRATPGLTLFATIGGNAARLINMTGKVVQELRLHSRCSTLVQLLPGGHLLSTELSEDGRGRGRNTGCAYCPPYRADRPCIAERRGRGHDNGGRIARRVRQRRRCRAMFDGVSGWHAGAERGHANGVGSRTGRMFPKKYLGNA